MRCLRTPENYKESTNSDSGTEADDEHFLKGLPAPRLRSHKGLRGVDRSVSSSPSPSASPALLGDEPAKGRGFFRRSTLPISNTGEEDARKAVEAFRQKRRIEVIRRSTEFGIMLFVAAILCFDAEIRALLRTWKKGLS